MLDVLIGGLAGAVTRLAPEVLRFFDRKGERQHELALGDQQRKLVELQGHNQLATVQVEQAGNQFTAALQALKSAYEGQKSGVKWADALSATVRPIVTYGFALAYLAHKVKLGQWTSEDTMVFSGILNFWFMGRVFEKATR